MIGILPSKKQFRLMEALGRFMIQYKGAQWFKCDFHLHTPASEYFLDRTITPVAWVQACLDAGLQCVAVTDHNTGAWIDSIKDAAKGKSLTVFLGVEIT